MLFRSAEDPVITSPEESEMGDATPRDDMDDDDDADMVFLGKMEASGLPDTYVGNT